MEYSEKLWKQYDQHIATYKFYLEMLVKLMTMFFAVSGAMISFYCLLLGGLKPPASAGSF